MRRNFLVAFSVLALPLLLLTVFINAFIVTPLTMRNSLELQQKTLALYRSSIEERLDFFDHLGKIVMQDKIYIERLCKNYNTIIDVTMDYIEYFNKYPDTYRTLNENLATFRFYVDNSSLNKDYVTISDLARLQAEETLYETLLSTPSGRYVRLSDGEVKMYRVLNYFKLPVSSYPVLEFGIRKDEMQRAVGGNRADESVLVSDTEGNLMVLSGDVSVEETVRLNLSLMTEQTGVIRHGDIILLYDTTITGWRVIMLITPSNSFSDAMSTRNLINVLALLSGAVTVMLIIVFSNSFSVRMRLLTDKILTVHRGKYHELEHIGGRDEISAASRAMDELAAAFSYMIETEYKWQMANTQLKLDLAYARINPHFLYNTLDAIDYYVRRGEDSVSINLIHSLAVFYRKSLNLGSDIVSVADELSHLESYIFIEMKMNDTVRVSVEVPDEMTDVRINAITLQPLVENAIQHGPDGGSQPLHIRVSGYMDDNKAILVVSDDGVGFPRQTAQRFNENAAHISGIGLSNVHARIRMRFGDEYGLHIVEKDAPGAEVRIIVPRHGE